MNKSGKVLIFFGLFWSGMTLMFDGFTVVPAVRQVLAQRFVATAGTVRSSEVTHQEDSDGDTHGVRISYAYTVAGREYVSDRYRYGNFSSSDCGWANQAVGENPPGKPVTAFYNPRAPDEALLQPGLAGSDLFMLMFMTPFNAVMLALWVAGWNQARRRWHHPPAGGVKLATNLRQTRARMTEFSPLGAGLAAIALLAFLGIFVVAFGFGGFHPPLRVALVAWGVVLIGGLTAAAWHWKNLLAGKHDLVIDTLNGTIQLPRTFKRTTVRRLALTEIHGAFVETLAKTDGEGSTTYTYAPTLRLVGPDGPTERLAAWHDEEKARAFVAWFNKELGPRPSIYLAQQQAMNPPLAR